MLSADVHLVVYGLGKQITDLQLSQFIQNKGIQVLGCDLITKYAEANSLTYKITIRACDYEKATKENICPIGVGVRLFKFFNNRPEKLEINNAGLQRRINDTNNETPPQFINPRDVPFNMQQQSANVQGMQTSSQAYGYPFLRQNNWHPQTDNQFRQVRIPLRPIRPPLQ